MEESVSSKKTGPIISTGTVQPGGYIFVTEYLASDASEFGIEFRLHRFYEGNELLSGQVYDAGGMPYGHPLALCDVKVTSQLVAALVQRAADGVVWAKEMIHLALHKTVLSVALQHKIQFRIWQLHTVIKRDLALGQMPSQCCGEHTAVQLKCLGQCARRVESCHMWNLPPALAAEERRTDERRLNGSKNAGFLASYAPEIQGAGVLKESVIVQSKHDFRPIPVTHAPDLEQTLEVSDEPLHDLSFEPL